MHVAGFKTTSKCTTTNAVADNVCNLIGEWTVGFWLRVACVSGLVVWPAVVDEQYRVVCVCVHVRVRAFRIECCPSASA
jgi:hypothetical protein